MFQFQNGAIKTGKELLLWLMFEMFQFQNGAIKTVVAHA